MYNIVIENTLTLLLKDDGKDISNSSVMGTLLNQEGIKELISQLPIKNKYINLNGAIMKLNDEQVEVAYNRILHEMAREYSINKHL